MIILGGYPDEIPGYIGPRELLERYQRGDVVTQTDALLDQSEWISVGKDELDDHNRDRLKWMTENLKRVDGQVQQIPT